MSLLMLVFIPSCQDYFEVERPPQNPWLTLEEFERAPVGAYGVLFASRNWTQTWPNYAVTMTMLGDDIEILEDPRWGYFRVRGDENQLGRIDTERTNQHFYLVYRGIGAVNAALDYLAAHDGNPFKDLTESQVTNGLRRIEGELHFLRGFCYYVLETMFGHAYVPGGDNSTPDLPLITSLASNTEEAIAPQIGTTQEVWDLIVSDLEIAKELLPEKYDRSKHDPSYAVRANRFAASAMLMRAYFQMGKYGLAKEECDYIIEQGVEVLGEYHLDEDPIEAWNKSGYAERGAETIWYLPYSDVNLYPPSHLAVLNTTYQDDGSDDLYGLWTDSRMGESTIERLGWMDNFGTVNDTSYTELARNDKRFQQLMMIRYPVDIMNDILDENGYLDELNGGRRYDGEDQILDLKSAIDVMNTEMGTHYQIEIRKVDLLNQPGTRAYDVSTLWNWKYFRGPGGNFTNVPLIRLAEVYLTRSALEYISGNPANAAADLNIVRRRAWDDERAGMAYQNISAADITLDMINDERIIEMFNEADRLNYLKGLKVEIPKGDRGAGSDPYTSDIFIFPIPPYETIYNENL